MTNLLAADHATEPGCYVASWWGQFGVSHLINQFSDDTRALRLALAWSRGWDTANLLEAVIDYADEIEAQLNDSLPRGLYATWEDGEFYIVDESR
jgi:hypothetical protein